MGWQRKILLLFPLICLVMRRSRAQSIARIDHTPMIGTTTTTTTTMDASPVLGTAAPRNIQSNVLEHKQSQNSRHAILGGVPAPVGKYPFYAHVAEGQLCGGSLIWPDIILSAAHCVVWSNATTAIIGSTDVVGRDGAERIPIQQAIPHPNYRPGPEEHDIMLVVLARESTGPIVQLNKDRSIPVNGTNVSIMGFGRTAEGGAISETLLEVEVKIVDLDHCSRRLGNRIFPLTNLCAGVVEGGKDACEGDSGGPLVDSQSVTIQYGVASFGWGCGRIDIPAVYTDVSAYTAFIESGICTHSANPPPSCSTPSTVPPTPAPINPAPVVVPTTSIPTLHPTTMPTGPKPTPSPTNTPPIALPTTSIPTLRPSTDVSRTATPTSSMPTVAIVDPTSAIQTHKPTQSASSFAPVSTIMQPASTIQPSTTTSVIPPVPTGSTNAVNNDPVIPPPSSASNMGTTSRLMIILMIHTFLTLVFCPTQ